jgi:hypothetical protein
VAGVSVWEARPRSELTFERHYSMSSDSNASLSDTSIVVASVSSSTKSVVGVIHRSGTGAGRDSVQGVELTLFGTALGSFLLLHVVPYLLVLPQEGIKLAAFRRGFLLGRAYAHADTLAGFSVLRFILLSVLA